MSADHGAARAMPAGLMVLGAVELAWFAFLAWMAWRS